MNALAVPMHTRSLVSDYPCIPSRFPVCCPPPQSAFWGPTCNTHDILGLHLSLVTC